MPRKAIELNRVTNFQQIVALAEKLVESLTKRIQRIEDIVK